MNEDDVVPLKDVRLVLDEMVARLAQSIGEQMFYRMMVEEFLAGTLSGEQMAIHVEQYRKREGIEPWRT